jgi:uncharacterized protein (DUF2235 family)
VRHLIVCCDGTWNSAEQAHDGVPTPTNVRMFHNLLADEAQDGNPQVARYFSGVGVDSNRMWRLYDGGTGHGLSRNIMSAYLWLARTYRPGDAISVVGFSRGAYTVRSLAGMLTSCGLVSVPAPDGGPTEAWDIVRRVYEQGYVPGLDHRDRGWRRGMDFHDDFRWPADHEGTQELGKKIEFLGVWDTVGALGVPDTLALLDIFDERERYTFHDTRLNTGVRCARHALALDERRGPFSPTLWTGTDGKPVWSSPTVVQLWFPGVHSDVGGGYRETGLADGALRWMLDEARDHTPLAFDPQAEKIKGDPWCVLHNSCVGLYEQVSPVPRSTPRVHADSTRVHESAVARSTTIPLRQDPYRRSRELAVGKEWTTEIFAHLPWNDVGLYVRDGTYTLTACGEWLDRDEVADPDGVADPSFLGRIAFGVGDVAGKAELRWQHLTGNPVANLPLTKRIDARGARWMQLIVVVANGGFDKKGNPVAHQVVQAGRGPTPMTIEVDKGGYVYAFANDAWELYGNNRGSVTLTVRRDS